jgi:hypothetical protein
MKYTQEQEEAIKKLREILEKGGRKVYTIVRHRSSSGMFRLISCFSISKNEPICLDWYIAKTGLYTRDKQREGLRVSGCGMDMGFSVVYNVGSMCYPNGDGKAVTGRNGDTKPETDGGYLLKQIWL